MSWKCFFGHKTGTYNIINAQEGTYTVDCPRCGKVSMYQDTYITERAASMLRELLQETAWKTLESLFPETFHKESGKTKHVLSYHPSGEISFRVDLKSDQIATLREVLHKTHPTYKTWRIIPVIQVV